MDEFDIDDEVDPLPAPDYNVAPTVPVPAIFERRVSASSGVRGDRPPRSGTDSGGVRRRLAPLVWGLVPSWAKDASIGSRMINARLETVDEKPAFRKAFAARRCLLPADGFYEWYAVEGPPEPGRKGKPRKQPFFIRRSDGRPLFMAGLYEIWRNPALDRDDEAAWLRTCTVITTEATDAVGHIHHRMPMVVRRDAVDGWLDPGLTDPARVKDLLAVTEADLLEAYAVSTEVNSVRNNHAALRDPIPPEETLTSGDPAQDPLI